MSAMNHPKSSPTTKWDTVADESRKKKASSVTWSPARLCLCCRDGKLCYYGRLKYDFLAFFRALLPTSLSRYVCLQYHVRVPSSVQQSSATISLTKYVDVKTTSTTTTATRIYVTKDTYTFTYSDLCCRWTCTSTYLYIRNILGHI